MITYGETARPVPHSITIDSVDGPRTVQVVYLAGDGRSGTTLMSRILGSYDGCMAVGELYDIWSKSLDGDGLCSCGTPLRDCEFWNAVLSEALGEVSAETLEQIVSLRASVQGMRHVSFLLFPRLRTPAFNRRLREYVGVLERLYLAIQNVSGCEVVVDSSKLATYAIALSESPTLDVRMVHMTRDSRACAYSWRRLKREPSSRSSADYLRQRALVQSAVVWTLRNTILIWASRQVPASAKLKYEDFVRQPRQILTRLVGKLDVDESSATWTGDDELFVSGTNHIFAGNPNRVEHGTITIRADDEWRTQMPRGQIALVTALTLPALWKLGYLTARWPRSANPGRTWLRERPGRE